MFRFEPRTLYMIFEYVWYELRIYVKEKILNDDRANLRHMQFVV